MDSPIAIIIIIGIAAIIIAALIGIAFGLFSTSKGTANDGVVQVQGQVGQMNQAVFQDYDQKTMVGSQVTSAINSFKNGNVAVVVKTAKGTWKNYGAVITPFGASALSGASGLYAYGAVSKAFGVAGSLTAGLSTPTAVKLEFDKPAVVSNGVFLSAVPFFGMKWDAGGCQYIFGKSYVEYSMYSGATTVGTASVAPVAYALNTTASPPTGSLSGTAGLVADETTPIAFVLNGDGSVVRNDSTSEVNAQGGINFVNPTSLFKANIIRDAGGDPIGVMFIQQGKHTHN